MAHTIVLKPAAVRDLRKLPDDIRRRVAGRIDALSGEPRPPGAEPLHGERNLYRIRVGDYRVIYQVENKALIVLVVHIGNRREVYRRLGG